MRQHIIPSIVATVIASGIAGGVGYYAKPTQVVVHTKGDAQGLRKTEWPELMQAEVDTLTMIAKRTMVLDQVKKVTIFCVEQARCGDLALNFDNALESAHIDTDIQFSPVLDPGLTASAELADIINLATDSRLHVRTNGNNVGHPFISIGSK